MNIYIVCPEKVLPAIVNIMRTVARHWCNLAAKDGGLECACMNNDNFTVLVSGGGRHHWVSMCTVSLLHSKWLSKYSKESAWNFALNLNIPPWKLLRWFRRLQLWATGDWQLHHEQQHAYSYITSGAEFFGETSNHPGDSAPPTAQIWCPVTFGFSQN